MRRVLAISGKRFSGKNTFADLVEALARKHGVEIEQYAFANESKRMFVAAQRERGVEIDLARLSDDRAYKETWRPELTSFTVAAIADDPLVFVRGVARRIEAEPHAAVITDLRLRLEVDCLQSNFDLIAVRLERNDERRAASGWTYDESKDQHHTETELDDYTKWTSTVSNNGTAAELEQRAAQIVSVFLP